MADDAARSTSSQLPDGLDQIEMKVKKSIPSCVALHVDQSAVSKYSPVKCDAHDNTDCVLDTLFAMIADPKLEQPAVECLVEDLNFVLRDEHKGKLQSRLTKTLPQLQSAEHWEAVWDLVIKLTDSDLGDKFEQETIHMCWRTNTKRCVASDSLCMFTQAVQRNCDKKHNHTVIQLRRCLDNYQRFMSKIKNRSSRTQLDWTPPVIKIVKELASELQLRKRLKKYSGNTNILRGICATSHVHPEFLQPVNTAHSLLPPTDPSGTPLASAPPVRSGNVPCNSCGQSESSHPARWDCPGDGAVAFCSAYNRNGHTHDHCPKQSQPLSHKDFECFNCNQIGLEKFTQQLDEAKENEMKMAELYESVKLEIHSLTQTTGLKNGLIEWLRNEVKRMGELETQMEKERDRAKHQSEKMKMKVEQLEKELKSERGRTSSLEANAGVWQRENNRLLEITKQYEAKIRKLQQQLQTLMEKNASHSERQTATNKTDMEELETAPKSQEIVWGI